MVAGTHPCRPCPVLVSLFAVQLEDLLGCPLVIHFQHQVGSVRKLGYHLILQLPGLPVSSQGGSGLSSMAQGSIHASHHNVRGEPRTTMHYAVAHAPKKHVDYPPLSTASPSPESLPDLRTAGAPSAECWPRPLIYPRFHPLPLITRCRTMASHGVSHITRAHFTVAPSYCAPSECSSRLSLLGRPSLVCRP
jgi:hypothetical protein